MLVLRKDTMVTKEQKSFLDVDIATKEKEIAKLSDNIGEIRRKIKVKKQQLRKLNKKRG